MNPMNAARLVEKREPRRRLDDDASLWRAHATADRVSLPVDAESMAMQASRREIHRPADA